MSTSIRSADATALPSVIPALASPMPRRGFLAGLARLPLIGGSVALLGQPSAVAQPATLQIVEAYKTWLHYEHRRLSWEMADFPTNVAHYGGTREERYSYIERLTLNLGTGDACKFHWRDDATPAFSRAALVLSTVGCDWRDDEAPADWLLPLGRA